MKFITNQVGKRMECHLKADRITGAQGFLLKTLQRYGPISMKDLERILRVSQPTVVGLVHRCEAKDLVHVFGKKEDRRVKLVELTEKGMEHCHHADEKMSQMEQEFTAPLTEEEKGELLRLLRKISSQFAGDDFLLIEEEETHAENADGKY